jgi:hypothetical protein
MNAGSTSDDSAEEGGVAAPGGPGYDHPSDWKGNPDETPWTIYFYYDRRTADGGGTLEVYESRRNHAISDDELKSILIPQLTRNARGSKNRPRVRGNKVSDVDWKRKSYIVFALDTGEAYDKNDALWITREPGHRPNHSFFDGGVGEIEVDPRCPIQAVWTVNYRKNEEGGDLTNRDKHNFTLSFKIKGRNRRHPPIVDGGDHGQNDGGSTAPPPGRHHHEHH